MAQPRIARTLEEFLAFLNDRIRKIELSLGRSGNWSIIEDSGNGQLLAVRDNGQGVFKTIRKLADPAGSVTITADSITTDQIFVGANAEYLIGVNGVGQLVAASQNAPFTVTLLAVP